MYALFPLQLGSNGDTSKLVMDPDFDGLTISYYSQEEGHINLKIPRELIFDVRFNRPKKSAD